MNADEPVPAPETRPPGEGGKPAEPPAALVRGLAGALLGAGAGYYLFFALYGHGIYAPIIVGPIVGLGASLLGGRANKTLGILCAALGAAAAIWVEAAISVLREDNLVYFLTHPQEWRTLTLIAIPLNAFLAYWIGARE